jgi:hypothetical protein
MFRVASSVALRALAAGLIGLALASTPAVAAKKRTVKKPRTTQALAVTVNRPRVVGGYSYSYASVIATPGSAPVRGVQGGPFDNSFFFSIPTTIDGNHAPYLY